MLKESEIVKSILPELDKYLAQEVIHDFTKFNEPELTPYILQRWTQVDKGFKNTLTQDELNWLTEATEHHTKYSKHHPEYWLDEETKNKKLIDPNDRGKTLFTLDLRNKMSKPAIVEMIADWSSSSDMHKSDPRDWMFKSIGPNSRWLFTKDEVKFMYDLIKESFMKEHSLPLTNMDNYKLKELLNVLPDR